MTKLLARAFQEASRLPMSRQDELAQALLDELERESPSTDTSTQKAQRSEGIADEALAHLVREGWLTPPAAISQEPPPRIPAAPFLELMEELEADRGER
jgi:hypothetical protein